MNLKQSFQQPLTKLFTISLLVVGFSCNVINPNYKIAGKYTVSLDKPRQKNDMGSYIAKRIMQGLVNSEVEFFPDGQVDFDLGLLGLQLDEINTNLTYEVSFRDSIYLVSDDGDRIAFKLIKTTDGFEVKGKESSFYLKEIKER